MIITGAVIVAIVLIIQRKKEPVSSGKPRAFPGRAGPLREDRPSPEELKTICSGTGVEPDVLDSVIRVAQEIAREGREGQAIGTAFVVGDTKNVLNYSKQFVLNPFHGHHETERQITDAGIQGTIKEFAQLDGAFLITGTGVVEAAGRCITVDLSQVNLPGGWVHGTCPLPVSPKSPGQSGSLSRRAEGRSPCSGMGRSSIASNREGADGFSILHGRSFISPS